MCGKLYTAKLDGHLYLRDSKNRYYHVGRDTRGDLYPTYYDSTTHTTYPLYYDSTRDNYYHVVRAGNDYYRGYVDDSSDTYYKCNPDEDSYYADYDDAPSTYQPVVYCDYPPTYGYYADHPYDGGWYVYHPYYYGGYDPHHHYYQPSPSWLAVVPIVIGAFLLLQPHHYHDHYAWFPQPAPVYQRSVYAGSPSRGTRIDYVDVSNAYYNNVNISRDPVSANGGLPPVARYETAAIRQTAVFARTAPRNTMTAAAPGRFSPGRVPGAVGTDRAPQTATRTGGYAAHLPQGAAGRAVAFSHQPAVAMRPQAQNHARPAQAHRQAQTARSSGHAAYRTAAAAGTAHRTHVAHSAAARPANHAVYRRPLVARAHEPEVRRSVRPQQYRHAAVARAAMPQRFLSHAERPRRVAARAPERSAVRPAPRRVIAMHRTDQSRPTGGQPSFQPRGMGFVGRPRESAPQGSGGRPEAQPRGGNSGGGGHAPRPQNRPAGGHGGGNHDDKHPR
jgi:hypothetical protein